MLTLANSGSAQISANYQVNYSSGSFYDSMIQASLITSGQSSLAGVTAPQGSLSGTFPVSGLNDGSGAGNNNYTYYSVTQSPGDVNASLMPDSLIFQLTSGFTITNIEVFSGWGDHNLGEQSFQVLFSIGGGAFTSYGNYLNNASITTGGSASGSYLTTLTDQSGALASDVTSVEFIFSNPDTGVGVGSVGNSQAGGGSNGGSVLHELEVFGTITPVPEPSTIALLGLAATSLVAVRRRMVR